MVAKTKTALICGVSGQDGPYLAQYLLNKGYRVVGSTRSSSRRPLENLSALGISEQVDVVSLDLNDRAAVLKTIDETGPDEVYNLAGQSSVGHSFECPAETFESIAMVTVNLLEALRQLAEGTKLFSAGSGECFGETMDGPADEGTPFDPKSPYAAAKAAAFWAVSTYREAYRLFACTGILFNHESPLRPERFVTRKIMAAVDQIRKGGREKLRLGNITVRRDWGWAPEYVEAFWRMLQKDEPEDFIIATGEQHSLEELVAEAFSSAGLDWRDHVVIDAEFFRPTDLAVNYGDPAKAAQKLDWRAGAKIHDVVGKMLEAEAGAGRPTSS